MRTIVRSFAVCCIAVFIAAQAGNALAQESWLTASSEHFVVTYRGAPEDFIRRLLETAEGYYHSIAQDLGFTRFKFWLWDDRAQIYVYDDAQHFQAETGQLPWAGGDCLPQSKIIRTYVFARGFTETVLPHELSHIIFREFVGFGNPAVPAWLDEGVASYREKGSYAMYKPYLQNAKRIGSLMSLQELGASGPYNFFSQESAKLFYMSAYSVIDFLIVSFGSEAFVTFCQHLRDKRDFDRAIASAYPFGSLAALDEAWQRYVEN